MVLTRAIETMRIPSVSAYAPPQFDGAGRRRDFDRRHRRGVTRLLWWRR
jgi:hypothetical protein